jgi:hypothetical protein
MAHESPSTANYAAVIKDLRAKRDELDRAIAILESLSLLPVTETARVAVHVPAPSMRRPSLVDYARAIEESSAHASGNNGIGEACVRVLSEAGIALTTREVTERLGRSGFKFNTKNPVNNVWSALSNRSKTKKDIRRIGEGWLFLRDTKAPEPHAAYGTSQANA